MKKVCRSLAAMMLIFSVILLSSCTRPKQSVEEKGKYDLLFGASSTAGMAYQWVTAFCELINDHSDTVQASAITTLGSSENINLLAANEIDAGISTNIVASTAMLGEADWAGHPVSGLNIVSYMYADYCYICVPKNSPAETLEDLCGKRVNIGEKGGGVYTGMVEILKALGLGETYFKPYYLSVSDAVSSMQDGALDAVFIYGSATNSSIMELQASKTGLKVIGFTPDEISTICENNTALKPVEMNASYEGIPPVSTVGGAMCFMATEKLPVEVSHELCRIIDEYHDEFVTNTRWAETSTPANTAGLTGGLIPLSEGTAQYLREIGID